MGSLAGTEVLKLQTSPPPPWVSMALLKGQRDCVDLSDPSFRGSELKPGNTGRGVSVNLDSIQFCEP